MPKLILRCNYLKNAPPSHLANYMNYISTREGVEKIDNTFGLLPAMVKKKELIADILSKIEDADRMHEYYDYLQRPTRENATEFITQALENNLDIIAKKKNYIDYLANRPRVEKIGTHGLFSNEGESIVLSRVAEEVANHPGVIWTNVISLRREDAERLGYDSAAQWQALLRSRVELLCENYKIDSRNLKWYAAFHNESHHPHVHLVVYSTNPSEGYLSPKGIDTMRSTTWSRNGKKKIVWRCSNRLTNGTKDCKKSETLEEGALNRAVMEAINRITCNDGDFVGAFRQNVIRVIGSYGGEQEPDEYDEKIKEKEEEMVALIAENARVGSYTDEFDERHRRIAEEITTLKEEQIEARRKKKLADSYEQRLKDMDSFLKKQTCQIPEFDNDLVRRLIASIKVVSAEKLIIQFQSGIIMEQEIRYE